MREFTVFFCVEDAEVVRGEKPADDIADYCEIINANSSEEAITDLMFSMEVDIGDPELFAIASDRWVDVFDRETEELVWRYCGFFVHPTLVEELCDKLDLSLDEAAELLEMPEKELEKWVEGRYIPPHWAEKLVIEKLESFLEKK